MTEANGNYTIASETERPQPRPGAWELERIIAAREKGIAPDPDDLAAVQALLPASTSGNGYGAIRAQIPAVMDALHGADVARAEWARALISPLVAGDPADRLDAVSLHAPNPPPISWLVKGWMPESTLTVLTGAGGAGKSRIALQLAVASAIGAESFIEPAEKRRPLVPHAPELLGSGPVVFAAWETRRLAFANRLAAICGQGSDRGKRMEKMSGNLHYVNMRPEGGLWGAAPGAHTSTAGGWLPGAEALLAYAGRIRPRLLIIDPLAAAFVANENDRALVRAFLSALDQWAEDSNCSVLIISHPPKSGDPQSGSTDWRNGVQAVWELAPADKGDPDSVKKLRVDKLNEGPIPPSVSVDFEAGRFVEVNEASAGQGKTERTGQDGPSTKELGG